MIDLKEACDIILSKHQNEYIHVVNDHGDFLEFVLMRKGEEVTNTTAIFTGTILHKDTLEIEEDVWITDERLKGEYKQYTTEDIRNGNGKRITPERV